MELFIGTLVISMCTSRESYLCSVLYRPYHSVIGVPSVSPQSVKYVLRKLFDSGNLGEQYELDVLK
jgi:hypothetical protein